MGNIQGTSRNPAPVILQRFRLEQKKGRIVVFHDLRLLRTNAAAITATIMTAAEMTTKVIGGETFVAG
jgi:hypothetical protein